MFWGELILGELFRGNCPAEGGGKSPVGNCLGGNFIRAKCLGGSCTGGNYLGVVVREGWGWQKSGGRGNCPEVDFMCGNCPGGSSPEGKCSDTVSIDSVHDQKHFVAKVLSCYFTFSHMGMLLKKLSHDLRN